MYSTLWVSPVAAVPPPFSPFFFIFFEAPRDFKIQFWGKITLGGPIALQDWRIRIQKQATWTKINFRKSYWKSVEPRGLCILGPGGPKKCILALTLSRRKIENFLRWGLFVHFGTPHRLGKESGQTDTRSSRYGENNFFRGPAEKKKKFFFRPKLLVGG